ncbi:MAG: zinc-dependent alcohol dehydrogenase [Mycobacteriales bacterium]
MRALVLRDFWRLEVEDRPDPQPGPDEVVISVIATGICGSDIHGYTGENGRRVPGQIMGHESVGRILAAGPGVDIGTGGVVTFNPVIAGPGAADTDPGHEYRSATRAIIGVVPDRAAAFAEQVVVPAANVVPLPDVMPAEYGALIEPLSVGYHAVVRGAVRAHDRVLVLGGGPIGQACYLGVRRAGASAVIVSEPNPQRRALLTDIGARALAPAQDLAGAVRAALGGKADVVIDAVGINRTIADALTASKSGARIVLVGMGSPELSVAAYAVSTEERSIIGSFCYSAAEFRDTAEWVGTAPAEVGRLIEGRVGLDDADEAFTRLARGTAVESKILICPGLSA